MEKNLTQKGVELFLNAFKLNACFMVANFPLIFIMMSLRVTLITAPFYLLGLLFVSPALQALFSTLRHFKSFDSDESLMRRYFKNYKEMFKDSFILGSMYLAILLVLLINVLFVHVMQYVILMPFFLILIVGVLLHFLLTLLIHATFVISKKDGLKLAVHLMSKYPNQTILLVLVWVLGYVTFNVVPQISILFIFPVLAFLVLKCTRKMLQKTMEMFDFKQVI